MGAVAAGVSVISGIGGLIGKNKQAAAQRDQLQQQQYQAAVQNAANQAVLTSQERLARQEYQTGVLSKLASYQQARAGLAAQDIQSQLSAQQQKYQIESQALTRAGELTQQQGNLNRQRADISIGTDQKLGGIAQKDAQIADQLANVSAQEAAKLTEAERRQISQQAMGKLASTSSETKHQKDSMALLGDAFSSAFGIDRTQTLAALQSLNEQDLALIAEQVGLNDNQASADTVTSNLKLTGLGAQGALDANASNLDLTRQALDSSRQTLDYSQSTQNYQDKNAYDAQAYSLGVQKEMGVQTGQSVQNSLSSAISNTKGSNFFDYLNFGLNTYGAVSPLLNRVPTTTTQPQKANFSGFPTAYQNYG